MIVKYSAGQDIKTFFSNFSNGWKGAKPFPLLLCLALGSILWLLPVPESLTLQAWHLFAIFLTTIVAIILKPLPMGAITLVSLAACLGTHTLTLSEALSHFNGSVVWLIVFAFYIARGFIKTGLGARIAYWFIAHFGYNSLGLAYSMVLSEFILSPAVPSNTARGAGIVFPIAKSLCEAQGSLPDKKTRKHLGAFLIKVCFQANVITSALFVTAIAGNPLIVSLAAEAGINLTWGDWCVAAIVPGIVNLGLLPLVIYFFCTPLVKQTPDAPVHARRALQTFGPLKADEIMMLFIFISLLVLWILGKFLNIEPATAALYGVALILITGILSWDDILKEKSAWDTLFWFTTLVMMASFLTKFGFVQWLSKHVQGLTGGLEWQLSFPILILVYFYIHYFFASSAAHVSSLYSAFLMVALAAGTPPALAGLALAFASSLCGGLTHYGTGPAPVFFNSGYLSIREWWFTGAVVSIMNLLVWFIVGTFWWKRIGLW